VAVLTDETGAAVERDSYDAWGKRRQPGGADDPSGSITSQTTRGFTSQEHLADVGLINFNARIYDPMVGRFLSADSIVPNPTDPQSFNRYGYVRNRPLSATDPSGHDDGGALPPVSIEKLPPPTGNIGIRNGIDPGDVPYKAYLPGISNSSFNFTSLNIAFSSIGSQIQYLEWKRAIATL
jgi:RHS repeat-associated protein